MKDWKKIFYSGLTFFILFSIISTTAYIEYGRSQVLEKQRVQNDLLSVRDRFENQIAARITAIQGLVSYAKLQPNFTQEEYDVFLAPIFDERERIVRNVTYLAGTTITHVYPFDENHLALGSDLSEVEGQREAVLRVKNEKKPTLAAPVDLIQGGRGIIARIPVIEEDLYLGQISLVFDYDKVLEAMGLKELEEDYYILFKKESVLGDHKVIWTNSEGSIDFEEGASVSMEVFDTEILLLALSKDGYGAFSSVFYMILGIGSFVAMVTAFITWNLIETQNRLKRSNRELLLSKEELEERYYRDTLTGLPNREAFHRDMERLKNPIAAIINLADFRQLNDFYGYESGDHILIETGSILQKFCEKTDLRVYRLVADEFSILTEDQHHSVSFFSLLEDLKNLLGYSPIRFEEHEVYVDIYIGVAQHRDHLLEKANIALNYGKKNNQLITHFEEKLIANEAYEMNMEWTRKILEALKEDRIVPYFQPIVHNTEGRIEKYECLVRMIGKNGEVISPYEFLDIARKGKIYEAITHRMLEKSFHYFNDKDVSFSLNLLIEDIINEDTRKVIRELLEDEKQAAKVVFEIVETERIDHSQEVLEFIDEVHGYGAKVAIDDFGTGYSNFSYLTKFNVDYIKLDGSLIKNIDKDLTSELITKGIVSFVKKLDISIIAEFVHSKEVYEKVKELDIEYSQGFYLGKPEDQLQS